MMAVRHFINGEWAGSADGATFESVSPIDNAVIAQVARGGTADADRAVDAARHAFDRGPWPGMSPAARKKIVLSTTSSAPGTSPPRRTWSSVTRASQPLISAPSCRRSIGRRHAIPVLAGSEPRITWRVNARTGGASSRRPAQ